MAKPAPPKNPQPDSRPSATVPPWGFVTAEQLSAIVSAQLLPRWQRSQPKTLYFGDEKYYCPPLNEALGLIRSSHGEFKDWTDNIFDCDDFAFVLKAHFCRSAFHNGKKKYAYCFGIVWKNKPFSHAMNWLVYHDPKAATPAGQFVFALVEPQNVGHPERSTLRPLDEKDGDIYFVTA